jgi:hypothetical protein
MTPIERRTIDYGELEGAMVHLELAIRDTRRTLDALVRGDAVLASSSSVCRISCGNKGERRNGKR